MTATDPHPFERYSRISYDALKKPVLGRKPRPNLIALFGVVSGFSNKKKDPDATCNMSYSDFEHTLRISSATVARAVRDLVGAGFIVQDKSNRSRAAYKDVSGLSVGKSFILVPHFLYSARFPVPEVYRHCYGGQAEIALSSAAVLVLSLIITHQDNPKRDEDFTSSLRGIAKTLNLSKRTVTSAITTCLRLGLLFRPRCGKNNYVRSTYHVNDKILRKYRRSYEKELRAESAKYIHEDEKTARERYYGDLRSRDEARITAIHTTLRADPRYRELERKDNELMIRLAQEEARHADTRRIGQLSREKELTHKELVRRIAALGYLPEDLEPRYLCSACHDTGFRLSDGKICDCYPGAPPRRKA